MQTQTQKNTIFTDNNNINTNNIIINNKQYAYKLEILL